MRIELTHDIIALKVWEQLPERDKQLRMVKNSLHQRLRDYNRGAGSLLGEKELIAWEDLLDLLKLDEAQKDFIDKSKVSIVERKATEKANEQRELQLTQQKLSVEKKARKRQAYFTAGLGVLALVALGLSFWAIRSQQQATEKEQEAVASAKNMALALQDFAQVKGKETFALIEKAEEEYDFKAIVAYADAFRMALDSSENRIKSGISNEEIIFSFTNSIDSLKNKTVEYISIYKAIVESGKAEKYKQLMTRLDQSIRNNKYDLALNLNKEVKELNIDFLMDKVNVKSISIKQQAFKYYLALAQKGFREQDRSLSGKFINPFRQIQKAESFVPDGTTASRELKQKICQHPKFQENNNHPEILEIKKICNKQFGI